MTALFLLRGGLVLGAGLLLTACGEKVEEQEQELYRVEFARPFPGRAADMRAFPLRHQGEYTAAGSAISLCIGPAAVWQQKRRREMYYHSRQHLDSLRSFLSVDSTYQDLSSQLHYLRIIGRDSVRDSWLQCDTVFRLTGSNAGRLRKFQGRYYLSTPGETAENWQVQRLEIAGHHIVWQNVGQDTLRLQALDTAAVHLYRSQGFSLFQLRPALGQQTRHVGDYAGLWETVGEFTRRH